MALKIGLRMFGDRKEVHPAETISVNMHGALVSTSIGCLKQGDVVELHVRITSQMAEAEVVSVDFNDVAIKLKKPQNIWGIALPPDDWYSYMESS